MSEVKVEDLSPAPFLARFLEDQSRPLTGAEMKAVRGGAGDQGVVNKIMADPPDWSGNWPFPHGMPPGVPGGPYGGP